MEQGEVLYAIAQSIIFQAREIMEKQEIPMSLWPIVMENVRAQFLNAAYDHLVAVRLKEKGEATSEDKKEENQCNTHKN